MERFADEDRAAVERWCAERRADVAAYLRREGITHGAIDGQPAWFVAPYASIWSVGALGRPGWRAWWVICGDLPTDCVDADGLASPREAMRAFGERWLDVAACMARGEPHAWLRIGTPDDWPELAPMLRSRAELLIECSNDESEWEH